MIFPRRYYSFLFIIILALIYIAAGISGYGLPSFVDQVSLTTRNKSSLTIYISVDPQESFAKRHFVKINYYQLTIPEDVAKTADEICIYSLAIVSQDYGEIISIDNNTQSAWYFPQSGRFTVGFPEFSPIPSCHKFNEIEKHGSVYSFKLIDNKGDTLTDEFSGANGYWYPYDGFDIRFTLLLTYRLLKDGAIIKEESTNPNIFVNVISNPSWTVWIREEDTILNSLAREIVGNKADKIETDVVISFDRPIVWKLLYPFVLTAILLLIGAFSLVDSLELFIGGAASLSFGIYGIRQVLSPTQEGFATILDVVIFGLYAAFAVSLIVSLIRVLVKERRAEILREMSDFWASVQSLEENEKPEKIKSRRKKSDKSRKN